MGSNPTAVICFLPCAAVGGPPSPSMWKRAIVMTKAAVAQLAARRSHNPKVMSSILTCRIWQPNHSYHHAFQIQVVSRHTFEYSWQPSISSAAEWLHTHALTHRRKDTHTHTHTHTHARTHSHTHTHTHRDTHTQKPVPSGIRAISAFPIESKTYVRP